MAEGLNAVSGRIIDVNDFQLKDSGGNPMTYPSGRPMMGVRIVLERRTGERSVLWADDPRMLHGIARAVRATGAHDIQRGGFLAVDGAAAVYERPPEVTPDDDRSRTPGRPEARGRPREQLAPKRRGAPCSTGRGKT